MVFLCKIKILTRSLIFFGGELAPPPRWLAGWLKRLKRLKRLTGLSGLSGLSGFSGGGSPPDTQATPQKPPTSEEVMERIRAGGILVHPSREDITGSEIKIIV